MEAEIYGNYGDGESFTALGEIHFPIEGVATKLEVYADNHKFVYELVQVEVNYE